MKKKVVAIIVSLTCILALFAGCGSKSDSKDKKADDGVVVINYPTFQCGVNTAAGVVAKLVEEFNAEYEGKYQIKLEEVP